MDLLKKIRESIEDLKSFKLYNPFYGKNICFLEGCVTPATSRNQLLGYLGSFCAYPELTNEVDFCIIPYKTSQNILNNDEDDITELLRHKMTNDSKSSDTKITNFSLLPEDVFFGYIKSNLLGDDAVKINQFDRIQFSFDLLKMHESNIKYVGDYNI